MTRFLVVAEKAASKGGRPFGGSAKPFGTKPQGGADAMPEIPEEEDELLDAEEVPEEGVSDDPIDEPVVEDEVVEQPPADEPVVEEEIATHEWSGDLIDDAVEEVTDPVNAFSAFTGQEGEEAWLDRMDDGTLTGWVRDADGSIYRYSDVDAWAVDVDDAGMIRADAVEEEPVDEEVDDAALAEEDGSAGAPDPGVDDFLEGKQVVLRAVVRPHP